ncbi:MAG TPA: lysophospholipid acyltransferase family protein [Spirochaetia bacterium]|nr:lysophospholipid acyltransferase family protein [Spirochaetales bacterium]HRY80745.1 lysophospholipid acyltransferase family protein [Spirochaetia bacterium]
MPAWYQDAAWRILRGIRGQSLLAGYNVSARFVDPEPGDSYVLLSNHAHRLDPWVVGSLLSRTIRYMANLEGTNPAKAAFADLVGAYGKRKGAPDYAALKRTLDLGRAGETLGIFPEGDRTWDGRPAPLRPGMGKLLRVLDKPVLLARQEGSYLTGPRWAQTERIGRWTVEFRVLSRERVAEEVPEALERGIRDFLAADDLRNPSLREVRFECSAPAAGIGRLLWLCPSCGESDTVAGTGDRVSCRACGAEWTVDGNQRLEAGPGAGGGFADLRDWTDFQRSRLAGRAAAAESLGIPAAGPGPVPEPRKAAESLPDPAGARSITASEGVELRRRTPRGAEPFGRGRLELFRDALVFFPADGGVRAAFDPGRVLYFVDNFNNYCEYSYGSDRYRLVFRGGNAYKWIEALEALRGGGGNPT